MGHKRRPPFGLERSKPHFDLRHERRPPPEELGPVTAFAESGAQRLGTLDERYRTFRGDDPSSDGTSQKGCAGFHDHQRVGALVDRQTRHHAAIQFAFDACATYGTHSCARDEIEAAVTLNHFDSEVEGTLRNGVGHAIMQCTTALVLAAEVIHRAMRVAVVGATGAVGREFPRLLEQRGFPVDELRLFAGPRSAGCALTFRGTQLLVEEVRADSFQGIDLAFFSAGAARSRAYAPMANAAGALVVDNSSAFRMDERVPLVVPEINPETMTAADRLVAVPNCSAILLLMAVAPLRSLGSIARIVVSTYQSASGAGAAAMAELMDQTRAVLEGATPEPKVLPHPYAFNLFSHNTPINEHGFNEEESKVIEESRKILRMPNLAINVTCVRVPVLRAHSESITVEFSGPAPSVEAVRARLEVAPGVRVVDDRERNIFPMPLDASGIDEVLVGRIRRDMSHPSAICLFACGDQLLKGAALNAVQIAELAGSL